MSKIQKPTVPDWMQPTAPLTDAQREELRQPSVRISVAGKTRSMQHD